MTGKRFTIVNMGLDGQYIKENGKIMTIERVVDLLNENEVLKQQREELFIRERDTKNELREIQKGNELLSDELEQCKAVIDTDGVNT